MMKVSQYIRANFLMVLGMFLILSHTVHAQNETFPAGSVVIDMGVTPQTFDNAIKPYGLVYALIDQYQVPVKWVINQSKSKDGIDFTADGINFRGGPFIIDETFLSPDVQTLINSWMSMGVVTHTLSAPVTAEVYMTINFIPTWTLDAQNGAIAEGYLENAGIPSTGYNWKDPQLLDCCDNTFVMPHADPVWSTHSNLYLWNQDCQGAIWAACHAVSALENMFNPANPSEQTNFLSTKTGTASGGGPYADNSLILWGNHDDGTLPPPYIYDATYDADGVMQFLGTMGTATQNGSEQIYLPKLGANWRPSTSIAVLDSDHPQIPGESPGPAAVIAFGHGFGDPNNGLIMYEAGHSHNKGSSPDYVAAQRAFFNFSFKASQHTAIQVSDTGGIPADGLLQNGTGYTISVTATGGTGNYSYEWTSSCAGTFSNPFAQTTTFTPAEPTTPIDCQITCKVTDDCGTRVGFSTTSVTVVMGNPGPVANDDAATVCEDYCLEDVNVVANDGLINANLPVSITIAAQPSAGRAIVSGSETITLYPEPDFSGTTTITYEICDADGLCDQGDLVITVEDDGCAGAGEALIVPNQTTGYALTATNTEGNLTDITALYYLSGAPDNNYTIFSKKDKALQIDLGQTLTAGTVITLENVRLNSATAANTVRIDWGTTALFTNNPSGTAPGGTTIIVNSTTDTDFNITLDADARYLILEIDEDNRAVRFDAVSYPCPQEDCSLCGEPLSFVQTGGDPGNNDIQFEWRATGQPDGSSMLIDKRENVVQIDLGQSFATDTDVTFRARTESGDPDIVRIEFGNTPATGTTPLTADATFTPAVGATLMDYTITVTAGNRYLFIESTVDDDNVWIDAVTWTCENTGPGCPTSGGVCQLAYPTATDDAATTTSNTAVDIPILQNDTEPNGDSLTIYLDSDLQLAANGTVSFITATGNAGDTDNKITYTPNSGYTGYDWFQYRICDSDCRCDTATVNITVLNTPPVAVDDVANLDDCEPVVVAVLDNDSEPDGQNMIVSQIITPPTIGTVEIQNGTLTYYIPDQTSPNSTDTFEYEVCDDGGPDTLCSIATVTVNIGLNVNNDPPVAIDDTADPTIEGQTANIPVLNNDSDPEGLSLKVTGVFNLDPVGSGTSQILSNGQIAFTPSAGFLGTVTFDYEVCDSVAPISGCNVDTMCSRATVSLDIYNQAPVATDDYVSTTQGQTKNYNLLSNDLDPDDNPFAISATNTDAASAQGGTIVILNDSTVQYTPPPGFIGQDTFQYEICDEVVPSDSIKCSIAFVYIKVTEPIDLIVTKSVSPSFITSLPTSITYTVVVRNESFVTATNVNVDDDLPGGVSLVNAIPSQGEYDPISGSWYVGTLDPDDGAAGGPDEATLTLEVTLNDVNDAYNFAQVDNSDENDLDSSPGNNSTGSPPFEDDEASADPIADADLSLSKSATNITPVIGEVITFTVTITNDGLSDATNVSVVDHIPPFYSNIVNVSNGGTYNGSTGEITWTGLNILAASGSNTLDLTFDATVERGGTDYDNYAEITAADQGDPDSTPGNNSTGPPNEDDEASLAINPQESDLRLSKTVSPSQTSIGSTVTFTLKVNNDGPDDATNIEVTDFIPDGYSVLPGSISNGGVYNSGDGTIIWSALSVLNADSISLTFNATVTSTGNYLNQGLISASDQQDPDSNPDVGFSSDDFGDGIADDDEDTAEITLDADLEVVKTVSNATPNVNDVVTFTITVTNNGPANATGVNIEDVVPSGYSAIGNISNSGSLSGNTITWTGLSLLNAESINLSFEATVDEPTGAGGEYLNSAQVTASDQPDSDSTPGDGAGDDFDTAEVTPKQVDLELVKTVSDATPDVGAQITFTLSLTNSGAAPDIATNIDVEDIIPIGYSYVASSIGFNAGATGATITSDDSGAPTLSWNIDALDPGENVTLTFDVLVNEPTNTAGEYENVAEVISANEDDTDSTPNDGAGDDYDTESTSPVLSPALQLYKTISSVTGTDAVGHVINYAFQITNTGNVTLNDITITDPVVTVSGGPISSLAPGATDNTTYTASYTITQVDMDKGYVENSAIVEGTDINSNVTSDVSDAGDDAIETQDGDGNTNGDPTDDPTVQPLTQDPSITVVKMITAGASYSAVGDIIEYEITLTNNGNVTVYNPSVSDPAVDAGSITLDGSTDVGSDGILSVGESWTYTAQHTVIQQDIDAGSFTNTATGDGSADTDGDGAGDTAVTDTDSATATATQDPSILVSKTITAGASYAAVGDIIEYEITLTNDGNVTVYNPSVSDPAADAGSITLDGSTDVGSDGVLSVGESWTYTAQHTVIQQDIDAGSFTNTATGDGSADTDGDGAGDTAVTDTDSATATATQNPSILINKTVTSGNPYASVGDVIMYEITIENDGNVTVHNPTLSDPTIDPGSILLDPMSDQNGDGVLSVGEIWVYSAQYTVKQQDLDNGSFTNIAMAAGSADTDGNGIGETTVSDTDSAIVDAIQDPSIAVDKDAVPFGQTYTQVGDIITYEVAVTNDGNITIYEVDINDPNADAAPFYKNGDTNGDGILDVGETWVYTVQHTITTVDISNGSFTNVATAQAEADIDGDGIGDTPVEDFGSETVGYTEMPEIGVSKRVISGPVNNGDGTHTLIYEIYVQNTGDVALSELQITEDLNSTFTGSAGFVVDDLSSVDFTINPLYTGISDINLLDGTDVLSIGGSGKLQLAVTIESGGYSGPYENTATAIGISPGDNMVFDNSQDGSQVDPDGDGDPTNNDEPTPVTFIENPSIGIAKAVSSGPVNNMNGTYSLTYQIRVQNTGDINLNSAQIEEDLSTTFSGAFIVIDGVNITQQPLNTTLSLNGGYDGDSDIAILDGTGILLPGENAIIELDITVNPNGNLGPYLNTAVALATSVSGENVSDESDSGYNATNDPSSGGDNAGQPGDTGGTDDPTPVEFTEFPAIGLSKAVLDEPMNNGDGTHSFTYRIRIQNTGNVNLTNIQVIDNLSTTFIGSLGYSVDNVKIAQQPASTILILDPAFNGDTNSVLLDGNGSLNAGEYAFIDIDVTVTPGTNLGPYYNSASAMASSPAGEQVTDLSDSGFNATNDPATGGDNLGEPGDTGGVEDPTPVMFGDNPIVGVAKALTNVIDNGGGSYTLEFLLTVENFGDVILEDLSITDDVITQFAGYSPSNFTAFNGSLIANPFWNGSAGNNILQAGQSLDLMESGTVRIRFNVIIPASVSLENQAMATGTSPSGSSIQDLSTDGFDPDGVDNDDNPSEKAPTPIIICTDISASSDVTICEGESAQLSVTGASQITWSPGTGLSCVTCPDPIAAPEQSTIYVVTSINNIGCVKQDTVMVTVIPNPEADFYASEVCEGDGTQFTDLSTASEPIVDWFWEFGDGTTATSQHPNHTYASSGEYLVSLTTTSLNGCTDTVQKYISVNDSAWALAGPDVTICEGECVQLTAQGGTHYHWEPTLDMDDPTLFNPTVCPTATTTYFVTVTNDFGCSGVDEVTVTVIEQPEIINVISTDITDCDQVDGTILIDAIGGAHPLEYSIDNGKTWQNSNLFTGLSAGSYIVIVRNDDGSCEVRYEHNPIVITAPEAPIITNVLYNDPSDCGVSNGNIVILAVGGHEPLMYSIDGGFTFSINNTFNNLPEGDYDLVVKNADSSCEVIYPTISLQDPPLPVITDVISTDVTDCGAEDGTITILADSDLSLEYSLNGGTTWNNTNIFTGLPAGSYTIQVRNENGSCEVAYIGNPVMIDEPLAPQFVDVIWSDPTDCDAEDGSITIIATGGDPNIEYSIDGGLNWYANNVFEGLAPGIYNVSIRNANGTCEQLYPSNPISLKAPDSPEIRSVQVTDVTDCGLQNGSINIDALPGSTGDIEYSVDGGLSWHTNNQFTDLAAGEYDIRVRNSDSTCEVYGPIVFIHAPEAPIINNLFFTHPSDCGEDDGTITIQASGENGLQYSIDGGTTWNSTNIFTGLSGGTYIILVRNEDATCEEHFGANPIELIAPEAPEILSVVDSDPTDCGLNNGLIQINVVGNVANYQFSIDGGINWSDDNLFTDLAPGTYNVFVRNEDSTCETGWTNNPIQLNAPDSPEIKDVLTVDPSNCGSGDGSITIIAQGGIQPLQYSINGGQTFQSSNMFENLAGGIYMIVVQNADGSCMTMWPSVILDEPIQPMIDTVVYTDPSDCDFNDGTITILASGEAGLEFSIDNGQTWNATNIFTGLGPGNYTIRVRNTGGSCEVRYFNQVVLVAPQAPNIRTVMTSEPSDCDVDDGAILISTNGSNDLEYSIDGGINWQSTPTFTGLMPGVYNVFVRNKDGSCEAAYVNNPVILESAEGPIVRDVFYTQPTDCGSEDGTITIFAEGGISPLRYSIDGGLSFQTDSVFTGLEGGVYMIVVSNSDGTCESMFPSVTLQDQTGPKIDDVLALDPSNCADNDGQITILVSGVNAFEYSIDGGATWNATNIFTGLSGGIYEVRIRNVQDNCEVIYGNVILQVPDAPEVLTPINDLYTCSGDPISVSITISENITEYTILGSGGYLNDVANGSTLTFDVYLNGQVNNFYVEFLGENGCTVVEEFNLIKTADPNAEFVVLQPNCTDNVATIMFTGDASPDAQLIWDLDGGEIIFSSPATPDLPEGFEIKVIWEQFGGKLLKLTLIDGGCVDDEYESIFVKKSPRVDLGPDLHICPGDCVQLDAGNGHMFYQWSPGTGLSCTDCPNPTVCPDETTTYVVAVMGNKGCMAYDTITVFVHEDFADAGPDKEICIGDAVQLNASGGVAYAWSPSTGLSCTDCPNPIASPDESITYTVTVTDSIGCVENDQVTVTVHPLPQADAGPPSVSICFGEQFQINASGGGEYSWSPATGLSCTDCSNPVASPVTTTTYILTVTDGNGCIDTDTIRVNVNPLPSADAGPNRSICAGDCVMLEGSGGVIYQWSPGMDLSCTNCPQPVACPEETTTYTLIVTDANGCTDEDQVTITVNPSPSADAGEDVTICLGEEVQLGASGGIAYQWSPSDGLSCTNCPDPIASPTLTTTYTVTATDNFGCTASDTLTVFVKSATADAGPDISICEGDTAQLFASGGIAYEWSPSAGLSCTDCQNPFVTATTDQIYTVTVTDANGCMDTDEVNVFIVDPFDVDIIKTDEHCGQADGNISVTPSGGVGPYNFDWDPDVSNTSLASGLSSGTYCVTITDQSNGCHVTKCVTLENIPGPEVNLTGTATTCDGNDGTIMVMITGGSPNYTIFWDGPMSGQVIEVPGPIYVITGLTAGTYTIRVEDRNGCIAEGSQKILSNPGDIFINAENTLISSCDDCDGEITVYVEDFHLNFNVYLNGLLVAEDKIISPITIDSVCEGSYVLEVIDDIGCTDSISVTVDEAVPHEIDLSGTASTCEDNDGTIMVMITGGLPEYSIFWEGPVNGQIDSVSGSMYIITGLTAGTYTVRVIDNNGCVVEKYQKILNLPGKISVEAENTQIASCDICDGEITVSVEDYHISYDVYLDGSLIGQGLGNDSMTIDSLCKGNYLIEVIDEQGCADSILIFVEEDPPPVIDLQDILIKNVTCFGGSDGYLGSMSGTVYEVCDSLGQLIGTSPLDDLTAGLYNIKLTKGNCSVSEQITIKEPEQIRIQVDKKDPECCELGFIKLTGQGGVKPYTFKWTPDVSDDMLAEDLEAGTYSVTVTDSKGCESYINITLNNQCDCPECFDEDEICLREEDFPYELCIECIPHDALDNYQIFVNGNTFTDLNGCNFDEKYTYSYACLIDTSWGGPFNIESWSVDGQLFMGDADDLTELAAQLSTWDTSGLWVLDQASSSIMGGNPLTDYGDLVITDKATWNTCTLRPDLAMNPNSVSIKLENPGDYEVVVFNEEFCCYDTLLVKACDDDQPCEDFIDLESDIITYNDCNQVFADICVDIPYDQIGNYSITDNGNLYDEDLASCGNGAGTVVILTSTGLHELIFTDIQTGCQDTVQVEVRCHQTNMIFDTITVLQDAKYCIDLDHLPGRPQELRNTCKDESGEFVLFTLSDDMGCFEYSGLDVGTEKACLKAEDNFGNTMTTLYSVTVIPLQILPFAFDDHDTTLLNRQIRIRILQNDTVYGGVDTLYIVQSPLHGEVRIQDNGVLEYVPNEGYCNETIPDEFAYSVCNQWGCDTAYVTVTVLCNNIFIYTGFSPNNDGVNDYFVIDGIEFATDNELTVYNRYGNQVFQTKNYQNNWDGTFNGQPLPDGTYFYLFHDGEGNTYSGYIQIQR